MYTRSGEVNQLVERMWRVGVKSSLHVPSG